MACSKGPRDRRSLAFFSVALVLYEHVHSVCVHLVYVGTRVCTPMHSYLYAYLTCEIPHQCPGWCQISGLVEFISSGKKHPFPSSLPHRTLATNLANGKMQVGFQIDQIAKNSAYAFCSRRIYLYPQQFQAPPKKFFLMHCGYKTKEGFHCSYVF